jgi:Metallopeptidase toxin 4
MIGRRGGTLVADEFLKRLEPTLLKNRVVVSKNADRMLAGRAASGIFRVFNDGSATIFLRSDRTRYELVHELTHYRHFRSIGADSFRRLTRLEQEQFVYDALKRSRHWKDFTAAEIQHAQDYIRSLGGTAW